MNWDNYTEKDMEAMERMGHQENRRGRPFRGNNVAYKWRKHFEAFDVWRFECPLGHAQRFHHDEIVADLPLPADHNVFRGIPGRHPLLTIPVFVKGSFMILRDLERPIEARAEDGVTFDYIDIEHGDGVWFQALTEGATFDCVCPKDKTAYYRRRVLREPGNRLDREAWVYDPQAVTLTLAQAGDIVGGGVVVIGSPSRLIS
jgi:hypothetical protein